MEYEVQKHLHYGGIPSFKDVYKRQFPLLLYNNLIIQQEGSINERITY